MLRKMALFTGADKPIAFEKTDDDNPSQLTPEKNIIRKCVYPTLRVEYWSV